MTNYFFFLKRVGTLCKYSKAPIKSQFPDDHIRILRERRVMLNRNNIYKMQGEVVYYTKNRLKGVLLHSIGKKMKKERWKLHFLLLNEDVFVIFYFLIYFLPRKHFSSSWIFFLLFVMFYILIILFLQFFFKYKVTLRVLE